MSIWDELGDDGDEGYFLILERFTCRGIDEILSRDEINVMDVLKSSDLIQEVNGMNGDLLCYLKNPEVAQSLIQYGSFECV